MWPSRFWFVTAVVTWPKMDGAQPVVQTTEIAPAQAGAVQQFAGEVAVRLTYDGTDAFLADPVTAKITAAWQRLGQRTSYPTRHVHERDGEHGRYLDHGERRVHRLSEHRRVQRHKWLVRLHDLVRRQHRAATSRRRRRAGGFQPGRCPHGNHPEGASGPRRPVRGQRGDRHRHSAHHRLLHRCGQLHDSLGGAVAALPTNGVPVSVSNTLLNGYVTSGDTWSGIGTAPITSLLLFPWSGVTSVWTGSQTYSYSAGSCPVNATGGSPTVYLPVYPLVLTGVSTSATP